MFVTQNNKLLGQDDEKHLLAERGERALADRSVRQRGGPGGERSHPGAKCMKKIMVACSRWASSSTWDSILSARFEPSSGTKMVLYIYVDSHFQSGIILVPRWEQLAP